MKKKLFFLNSTLSCWDDSLQKLSLIDRYIGELTDYEEIKTFSDNRTMTDAGLVIYQKEKKKFYNRIFQDSVQVKWFEANRGGNVDDLGTDETNKKKHCLCSRIFISVIHLLKGNFLEDLPFILAKRPALLTSY